MGHGIHPLALRIRCRCETYSPHNIVTLGVYIYCSLCPVPHIFPPLPVCGVYCGYAPCHRLRYMNQRTHGRGRYAWEPIYLLRVRCDRSREPPCASPSCPATPETMGWDLASRTPPAFAGIHHTYKQQHGHSVTITTSACTVKRARQRRSRQDRITHQ